MLTNSMVSLLLVNSSVYNVQISKLSSGAELILPASSGEFCSTAGHQRVMVRDVRFCGRPVTHSSNQANKKKRLLESEPKR